MQYDFSHDLDYSYMQMLNHTDDIHRVYLHCVIFYALEESCQVQRLYHTHYIHRVYLQHVLVHVFKAFSTIITYVMFLSSMGSPMFSEITIHAKALPH